MYGLVIIILYSETLVTLTLTLTLFLDFHFRKVSFLPTVCPVTHLRMTKIIQSYKRGKFQNKKLLVDLRQKPCFSAENLHCGLPQSLP